MKERSLDGKVIVVAGAAGGQGSVAVELLVGEGAKVVAADSARDSVEAIVAGLRGGGPVDAVAAKLDVTTADSWDAVVATAIRSFGRVDGLVNYAAVLAREGVEATDPDDWSRVIEVNLTGCWLGMRSVIPALRAAGGGSIVNIGSVDALVGRGGAASYQASKGGIRLLTKSAATEYARESIRVNAVHPGPMENRQTPIRRSNATPTEQTVLEKQLVVQVPMRRLGRASEIAATVRFLLSDEATYITGIDLPVDGGLSAGFSRE
jgi:NAD(P)-dependent dehydrogenase (short-subunit alcohol dehydrogenase family)